MITYFYFYITINVQEFDIDDDDVYFNQDIERNAVPVDTELNLTHTQVEPRTAPIMDFNAIKAKYDTEKTFLDEPFHDELKRTLELIYDRS